MASVGHHHLAKLALVAKHGHMRPADFELGRGLGSRQQRISGRRHCVSNRHSTNLYVGQLGNEGHPKRLAFSRRGVQRPVERLCDQDGDVSFKLYCLQVDDNNGVRLLVALHDVPSGDALHFASSGRPYPLTTTTLSVPGAKTVRGYSFFGDSYVCILFDDKTDPYWARSRVVEHLNQVQSRLPYGANAALGPDATGVGWVYGCALVDGTGKTDIGQLRALNDWFLKFELNTVPDVAEVASIGGMVRQHQVVADPDRMRALGITQVCGRASAAEGQPVVGRLGPRDGRDAIHGPLPRLPELTG